MAKKIIKAQMKQRQDTKANWAAVNPVLLDGELGMVSDDHNLYKVGDGRTAWNDLPFRGFDGTLAQELGTSPNAAISQKAVTEKLTELSEAVGQYEKNDEYIRVYTDAAGVFLFGIKKDGSIEWAKGVPTPVKKYVEGKLAETKDTISELASETNAALSELSDEVNAALSELSDEVNALLGIVKEIGQYEENEEYIRAYYDAEGTFLFGIKKDGSIEWMKGIPTPVKQYIEEEVMPSFDDIAKEIRDVYSAINEIEAPKAERNDDGYLEMTLDADNKVVSFRDKSGELVEKVGIKTKRLTFSDEGLSEFVKDLKAEGLGGGKSDLSDESHIAIPLPTSLVKVNITAPRFPTSKVDEIEGYIEFADRNGNYFKKPIEALAFQGSTSLAAPKKNLKFDFSDCTMKIGNWVTQDSFHLKSNYYDVFRGKSNLAYDLWRKIIEYNRPKTFRTPYINASEYSWYEGVNDMGNDFNEARLTPAGFPVELYFNGEYIGIYTWNIKKDRANYAMDKKKSNNIHIDPSNIGTLIAGESIIWENFEIRNPKSLITMSGTEYDGDAPLELIDSSSSAYNSSNSDHKRSAQVKASIIAFKDACAEVIAKKDKATFEQYFDKDWFIDFNIWGNVVLDGDSLARNTQYLYWGGKWYPAPYDCDQIYGNNWRGNYICRKDWMRVVDESVLGRYAGIYDTFLDLYASDIEQRYKELRDADVISSNSIIAQISQYVDLIGKDAYEREFELWDETPSYREPNDNPQWHYEGDYYEGTPSEWNNSSSYKVGDYVSMFIEGKTYYWKCVQNNTGVRPYYDKYGENPLVGGCFDSLTRTEKWLNVRFEFLDNHFNR